ncbi:MAG: hypothetical protein NUV51_05845, partial [Sulfuricaulis sp.]|nr:hypothetical protein [Sulfuricaulis sp.]
AWTTITDGTLTANKPIKQSSLRAMRDNPIAITEKAAGAPVLANNYVVEAMIAALAVTEAKLGDGAVAQGKLKTATGAVSTTTNNALLTLPGGQYGFWPIYDDASISGSKVHASMLVGIDTINSLLSLFTALDAVSGVAHIVLGVEAGPGITITATQRYIQGCPPYDLGDGEILLFVFAEIDPSGKIQSLYVAPEAPWHNNGPTDIRAERRHAGKSYRSVAALLAEYGSCKAARAAGLTHAQIADCLVTDPMVEVEITQAIKNADMPLIPHPFGRSPTGNTIVLLDPVSPFVERLWRLHDAGESVSKLIHAGEILVDNTLLPRKGPPGVMCCGARWKLTR